MISTTECRGDWSGSSARFCPGSSTEERLAYTQHTGVRLLSRAPRPHSIMAVHTVHIRDEVVRFHLRAPSSGRSAVGHLRDMQEIAGSIPAPGTRSEGGVEATPPRRSAQFSSIAMMFCGRRWYISLNHVANPTFDQCQTP